MLVITLTVVAIGATIGLLASYAILRRPITLLPIAGATGAVIGLLIYSVYREALGEGVMLAWSTLAWVALWSFVGVASYISLIDTRNYR